MAQPRRTNSEFAVSIDPLFPFLSSSPYPILSYIVSRIDIIADLNELPLQPCNICPLTNLQDLYFGLSNGRSSSSMAENTGRSHRRSDRRETSYHASLSRGQRGRYDLTRHTSCPSSYGQPRAPLNVFNEPAKFPDHKIRNSRNVSSVGSRLADVDENRFARGSSVTMPRPAHFQTHGGRRASCPSDPQRPNEVHPAVTSEHPLIAPAPAPAPGYSVFNGLYQIWNGQVYRGLIEIAASSLQHFGAVAMGTTSQETNPPLSTPTSGSQRVGLASGPSQPLGATQRQHRQSPCYLRALQAKFGAFILTANPHSCSFFI